MHCKDDFKHKTIPKLSPNFNLWRQRNFLCIQEMSNSTDSLPSERTAKELSKWTCMSVLQWSESNTQAGCERNLPTSRSTRLSSRSGNRKSLAQVPYTRWQITAWLPGSLMMLGFGLLDPEHLTVQALDRACVLQPSSRQGLRLCRFDNPVPMSWKPAKRCSLQSARCCCFKVMAAAPLSSCGQFHGMSHLQEEPWTSCSTDNTWSKLRCAAYFMCAQLCTQLTSCILSWVGSSAEHTGTRGGTLAWGGDIQPRAWASSTFDRCWTEIFNCYHLSWRQ